MGAIAHPWDVTPREAIRIQNELIRPAIRARRLRGKVRLVAGADVAFDGDGPLFRTVSKKGTVPLVQAAPGEPAGPPARTNARAFAAWVIWDLDARQVVEQADAAVPLTFPYVPGLLTFREGPALLAAWGKLSHRPDVAMFDGAGYAHPRRCGIASHLGVLLDLPTIGVAKSRLCGVAGPPGLARGSQSDLTDGGELIGKVLRTRDGVRPLFVSIGHQVTLAGAVRLTLACCTRYRLPEPTRLAHHFVTQLKRGQG